MSSRTVSRRPLIIGLAVLLLLGLAAAYFATGQYWRPRVSVEAFERAYRSNDREAVMALYRLALRERDDAPAGSERKAAADRVAETIEETVARDAAARYDVVLNGGSLSDEDNAFFAAYDTLSATPLLDTFVAYVYAYLRGEKGNEGMRHMLEQSRQIGVINQTYGRVENEYAAMVEAQPKIIAAEALMASASWYDATKSWQALDSDRTMSHFTKGYIEKRLTDAKAELLAETIKNVSFMLEQRRFYTARELLTVILQIFPYDEDLLRFNQEAEENLPKSFIDWNLPVDHIAVRPLIVSPERAFTDNRYGEAADRWLLLAGEFKKMLKALYDNNYVLVMGDKFITDTGMFMQFKLPEGKKPLVLVFDSYHFSTIRYLSGTAERLTLDADGNIQAAETDAAGNLTEIENGDLVAILEAFLREYPDFSFDGAKATVAVTGQYGLFGYMLNDAQALAKNELRTTHGLPPIVYDEAMLGAEREAAQRIADRLKELGYEFASNTYGDLSVPDVAVEAIRSDDDVFKAVLGPLLGDLHVFSYPGGRHANTDHAKTSLLTELGYWRLLAHGTRAFFAYGEGYTHIDMNLIGGQALRAPYETGVERYFDTAAILDSAARPH